jgi:kynurenine formamidase
MGVPSEQEVLGYFEKLSNWGRWGADDELGTINLITPEKRLTAAKLITTGRTITCSRQIRKTDAAGNFIPPIHMMLESGEGRTDDDRLSAYPGRQTAIDFIGMTFHGATITHVDALSHVFWRGRMYNNRPSSLVSTSLGATKESIDLLKEGVISRGVLLDIPAVRNKPWLEAGDAILPEDLEAAEKSAGTRVESGDVLLVRTGHPAAMAGGASPAIGTGPGLHASCLPWLRERGIAMLGSDCFNDVAPSGYEGVRLPVHEIGIVAMGLWLLDNCDFEELSGACKEGGRSEFFLCIAPLRFESATGSPVNPIVLL